MNGKNILLSFWIREELEIKVVTCTIFFWSQPAKLNLHEKSLPKQNTIQNFIIDIQGLRKTKNEKLKIHLHGKWELMVGRSAGTG